jgi:hypothetical protein
MKGMTHKRLLLRSTTVLVVVFAVAAIAWILLGVWGWIVVGGVGGAALSVRGILVLRRAQSARPGDTG